MCQGQGATINSHHHQVFCSSKVTRLLKTKTKGAHSLSRQKFSLVCIFTTLYMQHSSPTTSTNSMHCLPGFLHHSIFLRIFTMQFTRTFFCNIIYLLLILNYETPSMFLHICAYIKVKWLFTIASLLPTLS